MFIPLSCFQNTEPKLDLEPDKITRQGPRIKLRVIWLNFDFPQYKIKNIGVGRVKQTSKTALRKTDLILYLPGVRSQVWMIKIEFWHGYIHFLWDACQPRSASTFKQADDDVMAQVPILSSAAEDFEVATQCFREAAQSRGRIQRLRLSMAWPGL